jgi:2Fe-2S ferredoxin
MGGTNPYIKAPHIKRPEKKFKVTFVNQNKTIEIDPAKLPFGETGQPGSILDIAMGNGVDIDHACGGVAACSTCHVYVKSGMGSCSEAMDEELDMLDLAPDVKPNSRLSCQCVPNGEEDLVVEIPEWNRNLVREGH